ncbi:hypothetical protein JCM6882_006464 [Rhodosporidiobolus microsporus]
MSPPDSSSSPSILSPRLPFDVLHYVSAEAAGDAVEPEERAVARTVSLVCRDLRDVGQGILWRTLTLPSRRIENLLDRQEARRLWTKVKVLRWKEDIADWRRDEPTFAQVVEAFKRLLEEAEQLKAVDLNEAPLEFLAEILSSISSSPSRTSISSFSIAGPTTVRHPVSSRLDEQDLVRFLGTLPALSSFTSRLSNLSTSSPTPSDTRLPILPLRCVMLNTSGADGVDDTLTPSTPYYALASSLSISTLVDVRISRSTGEDGWVRWLSQPGFVSLQSLAFHIVRRLGIVDSLPVLSSCLSFHPTLRRLAVHHNGFSDLSPRDAHRAYNLPVFRTFLFSLPATLESLSFDFECPTDAFLDEYLQNGPTSNLWRFECMVSLCEQLRLVWNSETEGFDETCEEIPIWKSAWGPKEGLPLTPGASDSEFE